MLKSLAPHWKDSAQALNYCEDFAFTAINDTIEKKFGQTTQSLLKEKVMDFAYLASVGNEPTSHFEAMKMPDDAERLTSEQEEIQYLQKRNTWKLVEKGKETECCEM